MEQIEDFYQKQSKIKDTHEYGVDGIVIKLNSYDISNAIGYTAKITTFWSSL